METDVGVIGSRPPAEPAVPVLLSPHRPPAPDTDLAATVGLVGDHAPAVEHSATGEVVRAGSGVAATTADVAALALAALLAACTEQLVVHHGDARTAGEVYATFIRLVATVPLLALCLATARTRWSLRPSAGRMLVAVAPMAAAGGLVAITAWSLAVGIGLVRHPVGTNALLLCCGFAVLTVTGTRLALHRVAWGGRRRTRRVIIVGTGTVAGRVAQQLRATDGVEVIGFVDDDPVDPSGWCGRLADLSTLVERAGADHVIVGFTRASTEDLLDALRPIQGKVPITVVPRLFDVLPASAAVHDLGFGMTAISVPPAVLSRGARLTKRTIDVVGAATALLVLSPVLAAVALAIRLTSSGPVLFRQERIGRDGERFEILKFRSMFVDQSDATAGGIPAAGPFPKLKDDPRVTRVGRFIRPTSIDELPQLWNVLRGDMALVGPRPFIPDESASIAGWAERRYSVRPGITGLWQVSGRNDLTFDEMCRLDGLYVSSWCIALDLQILVRTLQAVVSRSGAY